MNNLKNILNIGRKQNEGIYQLKIHFKSRYCRNYTATRIILNTHCVVEVSQT